MPLRSWQIKVGHVLVSDQDICIISKNLIFQLTYIPTIAYSWKYRYR
jgi:hypothetical protein